MDFISEGLKGRTAWYWYLLTLFLVFLFWQMIGIIPLFLVAFIKAGDLQTFTEAASDMFMSLGIDSNLYLFLMLFTLISGLGGLLIGVRFLHAKRIRNIITARPSVDWKRITFSFILWFIVSVLVLSIDYMMDPEHMVWNFKPGPFFVLLVISFLFIPLQTSFEEMLFRGYLMQGLGILAKNRWLPLIATSIGFGLLHGANPEVAKLGWGIMIFYIGTGLLFGITTLMDNGTELALGMHAANNIVAALFVSNDWAAFRTDALFLDTSEPTLGMDTFLPVFVLYPIILLVFSKKYGWHSWQQRLMGRVEAPDPVA
ncbi:MAG: CPBP family intramembrane metalloprotease [Flavobacteriaceae bacterium]|nr:CPBP family intramembrane metalloprotease [Flavobacteriaceae bacterium]